MNSFSLNSYLKFEIGNYIFFLLLGFNFLLWTATNEFPWHKKDVESYEISCALLKSNKGKNKVSESQFMLSI